MKKNYHPPNSPVTCLCNFVEKTNSCKRFFWKKLRHSFSNHCRRGNSPSIFWTRFQFLLQTHSNRSKNISTRVNWCSPLNWCQQILFEVLRRSYLFALLGVLPSFLLRLLKSRIFPTLSTILHKFHAKHGR